MIARRIYPIKYNGVFVKGRVQRKKVWKIRGWGGVAFFFKPDLTKKILWLSHKILFFHSD